VASRRIDVGDGLVAVRLGCADVTVVAAGLGGDVCARTALLPAVAIIGINIAMAATTSSVAILLNQ
jgi:hypothetical protein